MRIPRPWFRKSDQWWYLQYKGRQIRLTHGRESAHEAQRLYHEFMAAQRPDTPVGRPLVNDSVWGLLDRFMVHAGKNLRPKTARFYSDFLNDFAACIGPALGVSQIRVFHVTEWLDEHPAWSSSTKNGAVGSVRRAFRWATEQGHIDINPLSVLRAPPKTSREVIVSPEQYTGLLGAIKDERFRDVVQLLWETGCRPQEACGLEARHVDLKLQRCVLPRSEAKGKKAPRVIYLNAVAMAIVQRLVTANPTGPLCRNSRGSAWTADAIKNRFARLEAKVGVRFCAYLFRHTWATAALKTGMDSVTASVLMGHADPTTIARTYQHLAKDPKYLQKSMESVKDRK